MCAILISAASFYATYLQADAAERQVKAMTLPLIQFSSSNWDSEQSQPKIILSLKNAGIGPAIIKRVTYLYDNKEFDSRRELYRACCEPEAKTYFELFTSNKVKPTDEESGIYLTSSLQNVIIPGQESKEFISLKQSFLSKPLWMKLNNERFKLTLRVCYCSLLGECYITEKNGVVEPIEYCPILQPKSKLL
ncbi:MAG: hypothetical protein KC484_00475 [Colwelliaceae bacterium]|nr:hypothetical protein [Colwelliaceae bacterium]